MNVILLRVRDIETDGRLRDMVVLRSWTSKANADDNLAGLSMALTLTNIDVLDQAKLDFLRNFSSTVVRSIVVEQASYVKTSLEIWRTPRCIWWNSGTSVSVICRITSHPWRCKALKRSKPLPVHMEWTIHASPQDHSLQIHNLKCLNSERILEIMSTSSSIQCNSFGMQS